MILAGDDKLRCGFEPRFLGPPGGAWKSAVLFGRGGAPLGQDRRGAPGRPVPVS